MPPQAILLVKTSSLGDVVHNLPVVSDLRSIYPGAAIDWVVEEGLADIPRLHPAVRRVIPLGLRRWRKSLLAAQSWREMAAFKRDLQAEPYDIVLDTQGLIKSGLITALARLTAHGRRCGFAAEAAREPLAARFYAEGFAIPKNLHAVERNRWLAAAACDYLADMPLNYGIAGLPTQPVRPQSWLPDAAYVVLLTATSREDKLWPEQDWLKLAAALAARGLTAVLPAGSAAESRRAARLAADMSTAVLAPPLGIADLAGLCAGAALVVGVDTGLTHLAAALARPTLALFCATDPQLTGVYAGAAARNLGVQGDPPTAAQAIAAALDLLG